MNNIKRAVSEEEKQQRVRDIIKTTEKLLESGNYKDITMTKIAQDTGLAKGTLFLYFQTKEELFLALAEQAITRWSYELQKDMKDILVSKRKLRIDEFVEVLINSLGHGVFVRLVSMLDDTLEQNIDLNRAVRFKTFIKTELCALGKLIEEVQPMINEGQGIVILNQLFISMIGAYKVSNISPIVREAVQTPGLEMFQRDFNKIMRDMALCQVTGYIAIHQRK